METALSLNCSNFFCVYFYSPQAEHGVMENSLTMKGFSCHAVTVMNLRKPLLTSDKDYNMETEMVKHRRHGLCRVSQARVWHAPQQSKSQ